jgi:CO/xanthine dehydrogenase Mo-binding subunit
MAVAHGMGQSVKRKEDARFIRGQGHFIDDIKLPGMLWLDIVRSPLAHAKINSINAEKALKTPGVAAVLTGKDLEKYGLAWMPTLMSDKQMVLPVDTVMYYAQEVAAVVATSRYAAADGVAAVEVDYEPLEPVIDPIKALQPDEAYYWATHQGAELDLLLFKNGRRIGVECKRADAPALTPSMRISLADLKLDELRVTYPGEKRYILAKKVEVVPLAQLVSAW